jgi:hypothetical protein
MIHFFVFTESCLFVLLILMNFFTINPASLFNFLFLTFFYWSGLWKCSQVCVFTKSVGMFIVFRNNELLILWKILKTHTVLSCCAKHARNRKKTTSLQNKAFQWGNSIDFIISPWFLFFFRFIFLNINVLSYINEPYAFTITIILSKHFLRLALSASSTKGR